MSPNLSPTKWAALVAIAALALPSAGCSNLSSDPRLNRWEIYAGVLAKVTAGLDLGHTLAVHPLLGQLDWDQGGAGIRMDAFNLSDTLWVKAFVDSHNSEYHLCRLTPQMTCDLGMDDVYIILSEPEESGRRRAVVLAIVMDNRSPPGTRDFYTANLQARRDKWRVVSLRRAR